MLTQKHKYAEYSSAFFHGLPLCVEQIQVIKSEKKRIKCSIFGRERVSEAIGQNLQVWAAG